MCFGGTGGSFGGPGGGFPGGGSGKPLLLLRLKNHPQDYKYHYQDHQDPPVLVIRAPVRLSRVLDYFILCCLQCLTPDFDSTQKISSSN